MVDSLRMSAHLSPDYGLGFNLSAIEPEIFFTQDRYLKATQAILKKLASRPGVILLGRGTQVIFKSRPDAFHIRLVAPQDIRVKRVQDLLKLSAKEAAKHVTEIDRSRAAYLRDFYSVDVNDAVYYHLTINSGLMDYGQAIDLIKRAMEIL